MEKAFNYKLVINLNLRIIFIAGLLTILPVLNYAQESIDSRIGNATPGLKTGDDGSITLYFSAESPGQDKESNWLPAPNGPWWLVMGTYGPDDSIMDGTYQVPPIKKQP